MRVVPSLLLALLAFVPTVRAQSITSFEPDTTARAGRARARPDTVDRPPWFGIQVSPVVGAASELNGPERTWDAHGVPWVGVNVLWPLASPHQGWLAIGYERWVIELPPDIVSFAPTLLSLISPVSIDQFTARIGIDWLIGRERPVSAALGLGFGVGAGFVQIPASTSYEHTVSAEVLVHALTYFRMGGNSRVGIGATGGPTFRIYNSSGEWQHWELELRFERTLRAPRTAVPGP